MSRIERMPPSSGGSHERVEAGDEWVEASGERVEAGGERPRILAVGAHPDDVEFMAAGTLARLRECGCEVVIATMTPGDCGSAEWGPDEIAAIRRREARRAASLLRAAYLCLEERDLAIDYSTASRRKVTALVRQTDPCLVLTHPHEDYMVDHEVTSRLVRDACFTASIPNYQADGAETPTAGIPALFYWDPLEGTDDRGRRVEAEFAVDIGSVMEMKRNMLACHASQRDWLRKQHGMDRYLATMEEWAARRGADFEYTYGEGFTQHRGHPYPQENRLLWLLGTRSSEGSSR